MAAFVLLAIAIGATGYFYLEQQWAASRLAAENQLSAIADLKAGQIVTWHRERRGDAEAAFRNLMIQDRARRVLSRADAGADAGEAGRELLSWLEGLQANLDYSHLVLFDARGAPRLWTSPSPVSMHMDDRQSFQAALRADGVVATDLHLGQQPKGADEPEVDLAFWVPIGAGSGQDQPAPGVLLMQIDPRRFIYPVIQNWPTPSRSAETLLVRREGEEVVYLNELRHRPGTALNLRLPLEQRSGLPAAMAAMGREGVVEGTDYRGVPVLAALRRIPGTPWFLVAKVDQEEIFAPLRERAWDTGTTILFLILAAALGVALIWRQRDNHWLKRQLDSERERQALAERLMLLTQRAQDLILLAGPDWRILEANEAALCAYGYSREELRAMTAPDLRHPQARADFAGQVEGIHSAVNLAFETLHQRKDGSIFPVEISLNAVELGGQPFRLAIIRDISERRQAEDRLKASEEKFRLVADYIHDWEYWVGPDHELIFVSPSCQRVSGYAPEEFLCDPGLLDRIVHPEDQALYDRHLEEHRWGEKFTQPGDSLEYRILDKAGRLRWLSHRCFPVHGADGRFMGRRVSNVDITARKLTEEALRESEARYRVLFQASPDGILIADPREARFVVANQAVCRMLGYEQDELLKLGVRDIHPPEALPRVLALFQAMARGEITTAPRVACRKKGGEVIMADITGALVVLGGGEFLVGFFRDVTAHWEAEEALRRSEQRYRHLFERSGDSVFIIEAEGPEAGRILEANEAAAASHGYTREELQAMKITALDDPESAAKAPERIRRLLAGQWLKFEVSHVRKDGSTFPMEVSAGVFEWGGRRCIMAFDRDISERKRAEQEKAKLEAQLRQSQKMQAIGTLAGGIAHDFNNILAAIMGFTELSLRRIPPDQPMRCDLEEVFQASLRARDLVRQILAFSRAGEQDRRPLVLAPLVKEAVKLLRAAVPAQVEIRQHLAASAGAVMADPTQVHQMIMNLGTNAAYAMRDKGGVLEVRLEEAELDEAGAAGRPDLPPGPYLRLVVSDTGHGMEPEVAERIFEPFFTTKKVGEGTGMGLSVVHGIVSEMGGVISVDSAPGRGTTVEALLPRLAAGVAESRAAPAGPQPTGRERLLLVDDEVALLRTGARMLTNLGYTVTTAGGGPEALGFLRQRAQEFDLVITDLSMPGLTGLELIRQLKALRPDLPVILCTGYSDLVNRDNLDQLGVAAVMNKPVPGRELAEMVRRVLDKGSA